MYMIKRNDPCPCGSGKKYKKCCLPLTPSQPLIRFPQPTGNKGLIADWQKQFDYGTFLMNSSGNQIQAISIFQNIVNSNAPEELKSGSCVNLASLVKLKVFDLEDNLVKYEKEVHHYLQLALKYNPKNTMVGAIYTELYLYQLNFSKALYWYKTCETKQSLNTVEKVFLILLQQLQFATANQNEEIYNKLTSPDALAFYKEIFTRGDLLEEAYEMITALLVAGNEECRVFLQKLLLEGEKKFPDSHSIAYSFSQLYLQEYLNLPSESLKYAYKAIDLVESKLRNKKLREVLSEHYQKVKMAAHSNVGKNLYSLGKYKEAIEELEYIISHNPNNTDLHNLASSYHKIGDYEKSIEYFKRCLFTQEDESAFSMLALNYYKLKNYEEARKYYHKALSILKSQELLFQTKDENEQHLISFLKPEWINQHLIEIYPNLINIHILIDDFIMAKVLFNEAVEIFPDEHSIYSLGMIIDKMIEKNVQTEKLIQETESIKQQLYDERVQAQKQGIIIRQWAQSLMVIQNKHSNLHLLDDEAFYKEMDLIIEEMKTDASSSLSYEEFISRTKKDFHFLHSHSQEFLATADYLYDFNKEKLIDFAPVLIEYVKVLENELIQYLKIKNKKMTLGPLIQFIEEKKVDPFYKNLNELRMIQQLRNSAAHTGQSTLEKVETVRNILFNDLLTYFKKQ